jgi:hypothetical protein
MSLKQTNLRNEYEHVTHGIDRQRARMHTLTKQRMITSTNSRLFTFFFTANSRRIHGYTACAFLCVFLCVQAKK